eukprot:662206-Rhodomonas_salina.1
MRSAVSADTARSNGGSPLALDPNTPSPNLAFSNSSTRHRSGTSAGPGGLYSHVPSARSVPSGAVAASSERKCPRPITNAPSTCPRSTAGFRLRAQSYSSSDASTATSPVATSSSTSVTHAAYALYACVCEKDAPATVGDTPHPIMSPTSSFQPAVLLSAAARG